MPRLSFLGAALALIAAGSDVHAQEVVKIDTESGRTIIDDEWRSMYRGLAAVDWNRKLLYVSDREEPDGIMVFSLETGEHVRTISTPRGDGPRELKDGRQGMAIKPDGGTYISGYLRVLEFDPAGNYLAHSFRAMVVTDLLDQGVSIEDVQYLVGHRHSSTTQIHDRRARCVSRNTVERISI